MRYLFSLFFGLCLWSLQAQKAVNYHLSFKNAAQHEAEIHVSFPDLTGDTLSITMSRSSPGRYALHEFVKNVYGIKAVDGGGNALKAERTDPYSWIITGHDGRVELTYTLFANRADGTYSDVSESHAHLNIPATLIYAPALEEREYRLNFELREDLNWKVATQLEKVSETTYRAPDLYYLMDSPVEISDYQIRSFEVDGPGGTQTIRFVLHHQGSEALLDNYMAHVKNIVLEEIAVIGEAPAFDFGQYTFLACYLPWVYGDGMEHRNSTILTSTRELLTEEGNRNLGTVAHELFHAWNVERLRPASLEPFDFKKANMSEALWFAEGFTSYYTNLILKRAGIMNEEEYLRSITPTFNYVWNSPGRAYFSPVEMSHQAPFVDAATSVDPVNRNNTFISYYSYGAMLGLALDLSLREQGKSLDGYFSRLWDQYGKKEIPYDLEMLESTLADYAGKPFANRFFKDYVHDSKMPDYNTLFNFVGVQARQNSDMAYTGIQVKDNKITSYPVKGSPAEKAGLSKGDLITTVNGQKVENLNTEYFTEGFKPGDEPELEIVRFGKTLIKKMVLDKDPAYTLELSPIETESAKEARSTWLGSKRN